MILNIRILNEGLDWNNYMCRHGAERIKIYKEEKFPYEIQKIKF